MSLKAIYDAAGALKGWFDATLTLEGWFDDELTKGTTTTIVEALGSAAGSAVVQGVGVSSFRAQGASAGAGAAAGVSRAIARSAGLSEGASLALGVSGAIAAASGEASGVATALGIIEERVAASTVDGSGLIVTSRKHRREEKRYRRPIYRHPEELEREQRMLAEYLREMETKDKHRARAREPNKAERAIPVPRLTDAMARAASAEHLMAIARSATAAVLDRHKAAEERRRRALTATLLLALD